MNYPEGLHLTYTPDSELGIFDAQDVCWIIFTDGGNEDPPRWQASIISSTCAALNVTVAINDAGDEVTVAGDLSTSTLERFLLDIEA